MKIAGFDQSLTSFGGALFSSADEPAALYRWQPGKLRGHERQDHLLSLMAGVAQQCDFVMVEGLAFGAKGSSLLDLAGLYGLMTYRLWQLKVPYVVVTPFQRAKYLTGRAAASKEDCLVAAIKRFPDIEITGNDIADAVTLAAMGADWAGFPLAKMPADQRAVLTDIVPAKKKAGRVVPAHPAIAWPDIRKAA
jgi:crossover junction endodeoxyribonuclease RuvC